MTGPAPLAAAPLRDLARRPLRDIAAGRSGPAADPGRAGSAVERRRAARAADASGECCDMCAEPVPGDHRHLLDPAADAVLCACRACALLFATEPPAGSAATPGGGASRGPRYRLIPQRRLRLGGDIDDLTWAALGVPVTLAFFVAGTAAFPGGVTACYPSPLGTTRAPVAPDVWDRLTAGHPALATLVPGTEALLVDRAGERHEQWIVPLDDCYRLVAVLRTRWRGFGGGAEARESVRRFFTGLAPDEPPAPPEGTAHAAEPLTSRGEPSPPPGASPAAERTRHG
ncbi:DUF5947 family protein [Streptomyces odontomachi]|uniref:DUF5947 family protein n=1 Tax=Streptomyces odontomachi TaxID=2944940 RepID=UPI00210B1A7E|nr:DUF5947 family protein [Streptomyces sp. ODS25]